MSYTITRQTGYAAGPLGDRFGVVEITYDPFGDVPAKTVYRITASLYVPELSEPCDQLGGKWQQSGWLNGWEFGPDELVLETDPSKPETDINRTHLVRRDKPLTVTFEQLDAVVRSACLAMGPPRGDIDTFANRTIFVGELTRRGIEGESVGPSETLIEDTRKLFAESRS
jgi:hypothetical protein